MTSGRDRSIQPVMKRLLASIHDVSPPFETQIDALADRLEGHLGAPRFAMLVVPDHWNGAAIAGNAAFASRLRRWADRGIEMFVHGWSHRDDAAHKGADAMRARHMTAGEGEFLGLSQAEALARMQRGKALVEDIIGQPAAGFIAPAWLYSDGAKAALAEAGFALAEDHMRVWRPADGAVLANGPVITWASRSRPRIASSLLASWALRKALQGAATVRVAVHPGDTGVPALLKSIDRTMQAFHRHNPARYAEL
jgi:uncharacterized protein